MTYRGIVSNGVVVLEGEKPIEGTIVEVTPVNPVVATSQNPSEHPAIGIWRDRHDLPADSIAASNLLRERLMRAY